MKNLLFPFETPVFVLPLNLSGELHSGQRLLNYKKSLPYSTTSTIQNLINILNNFEQYHLT